MTRLKFVLFALRIIIKSHQKAPGHKNKDKCMMPMFTSRSNTPQRWTRIEGSYYYQVCMKIKLSKESLSRNKTYNYKP